MWTLMRSPPRRHLPRMERSVVCGCGGRKRPRSTSPVAGRGTMTMGDASSGPSSGALAPPFYTNHTPLIQPRRPAGVTIFSLGTSWRHNHDKPRNNTKSHANNTKQQRGKPKQKPPPYRSPWFSKCQTLDKALDLAANHLDKHSPRDLAAFWSVVPRFLVTMDRKPKRHEKQMKKMHEKFGMISNKTLTGLGEYSPRDMSTVALGYAKIASEVGNPRKPLPRGCPHHILHTLLVGERGEKKHEVFTRIAKSSIYTLPDFVAQDLSNFIYAYGIIGFTPKLDDGGNFLNMVATEVVWALDNHDEFSSQAVSNIAWAYSTLQMDHPRLFEKLAKHVANLDGLDGFRPQALSNVVWAYASAGECHPALFDKIATHIVGLESLEDFIPQHLANISWAFANNGHIDEQLFAKLVPEIKAKLGRFRCQELANIAWSFAVADVAAPFLFNDEFVEAFLAKGGDFKPEHLRQLYLWSLWQEELVARPSPEHPSVLQSSVSLPPPLQERCRSAFVAAERRTSALEDDVVAELMAIGLDPQRQVLLDSGWRLDATVEVDGATIGIDVDGPSHFVGGEQPNGGTILKRRQVGRLDDIPLVSVPHWEWKKQYGEASPRIQHYLRNLLGLQDGIEHNS